ncbi:TonB-dependent receptor [Mariniflexile gromovii]|uniref:TonB-dependent receptor n=1 Tax=Mariniflexile gromovii TaxID=362523 RepID=A0ABS4BY34_9FLAO|nr:TonB-dependent receptor [Mariniflexile gromovii]MBP0904931.1 TonB-dependent receptor [Mariniflexile gromovii]
MKIIKKNKLFFLLFVITSVFGFAQERHISGTVTDEYNMPIGGTTIIVKGSSIGTTTDIDGKYELIVPSEYNNIQFSYVGFEAVSINLGHNNTIDVVLKESVAQLDAIVIKGFRGSEQRAIAVKRKAASVVEAITPEDIGNYSDENMADALQRVPGLQVERDDSGNGGGDRVSIRGVGPQFVNITVNGRTPLSAGSEGIDQLRQFNLDVLPTEVVQGAMVYKSSEAQLVGPGLGGAVDFQTVRPLSLRFEEGKNYFGIVNVRGDINDYGDNKAMLPRLSGLLGFKTSNNKLGFVVSAITSSSNRAFDSYVMGYVPRNINEDTDGDGIGDVVHEGVLSPGLTRYNPVRNSLDRYGVSSALQWKITENLEITGDLLYTEFDNRSERNQFRLFPQNETNNTTFPSADLDIDDNNVLRYFNSINSSDPISQTAILPTQYDNFQSSLMTGLNLEWQKGDWLIAGDYSYSNISFDQRLTFTQVWTYVPSMSFDLKSDLAVFNVDQATILDFNNPEIRDWVFLRDIMLEGNNKAGRIDITKEFNQNLKLNFGGRYSTTYLDSRQAQLAGGGQPWSDGYLDNNTYYNNFITGPLDPSFAQGRTIGVNQWLMVNQDALRAANPEVFGKTAGSSFEGDLFDVTNGDLPLLTPNSWDLEENTLAFYGQLDFKSIFAGIPVSGNVGVRAVKWDIFSRAFSTITLTDPSEVIGDINYDGVPTTVSSDRWNVLPSLNLNFALQSNFNLRLSAVNTVSGPDYLDLRPTNTLSYINPESEDAGTQNGTATLSNPELKPYSSWQFDTTGEWYNNEGGAVVLSGFYKLIDDFIVDETTFDVDISELPDIDWGIELPGLGNQLFNVTSPVNYTGVQLYGFEIGFRQPLGFIGDTFRDFGVQANYTFVDSKFDKEINEVDNSFPGSSKHNFNSVIYYDGDFFGIRVAYNSRSSFLRNIGGGSDVRSNVTYTDGFDRLDIRANFEVMKNLQLSISGQNLTASDRRDYTNNNPSLFTQLTRQGAIYTIGARYQL